MPSSPNIVNYVPVLKWKQGEITALSNIPAQAHRGVTPLITLADENYKKSSSLSALDVFIKNLNKGWANSDFYLDASNLSLNRSGKHPIEIIAQTIAGKKANMIPSTKLDVNKGYEQAVLVAVKTLKRGIAVRVSLKEFTSVSAWIRKWPYPPQETDLMVDLKDAVGTALSLGNATVQSFHNLHQSQAWRSITVIGTSMPNSLSGYNLGTDRIDRDEWTLWDTLNKSNLPYNVNYGDYATVPVSLPALDFGRVRIPANAKYTLDKEFLICRGVVTSGPKGVDINKQFIQHASNIVKCRGRRKLATCWADNQIDQIANGTRNSGSRTTWVSIGVNRHIELVRHLLP